MPHRSNTVLTIGICGLGTVGGGVVQLLKDEPHIRICKALVHDIKKSRPDIPASLVLVTDPEEICRDPQIDCIVEVMGGTSTAWAIVKTAIQQNKHVVTANKALISKYMAELIELLDAHPDVKFFFEAAVCGGIPIINALRRSYLPDQIDRMIGILNGTTNYMLSEMKATGLGYHEALKAAQSLGYAEADPSADVEGFDARSKLCILARLAYGITISDQSVPCQGISQISQDDFEYARLMGNTIKLVGIAETITEGEGRQLSLAVSPAMIPLANPLAHVDGGGNAVEVQSRNLGKSLFVGPGAGRLPTANSVAADVLELVATIGQRSLTPPFLTSRDDVDIASEQFGKFYVRFNVVDRLGIIREISDIFARHKIPVFSILQTPIIDKKNVPFAIITDECCSSDIAAMCKEVNDRRGKDLNFVLKAPVTLRYLD